MEKYIVAGSGISGIGSAGLLLKKGCLVTVFDENTNAGEERIRQALCGDKNLTVRLGVLKGEDIDGVRYCVMSPGISPKTGFAVMLQSKGVKCISEIELAYRYEKGKVAAVTGTNGKTTTTALLGEICKASGKKTIVAGNIGLAYTSEVEKSEHDSISVLEVAGFHLETIDAFRPSVSAILNITPDHLDRFGTMEAYAAAKCRITENQTENDTCVLNYEDDRLRGLSKTISPKVLFFSSKRELEEGAFLRGEDIVIKLNGEEKTLLNIHDMRLLGVHNYENVMAASLMALSLGIDMETIRKAVSVFRAVPHRIEFVEEKDGVVYYNDSKGTNPDASIRAVNAMIRPTVLIAGGYDKHVDFYDFACACKDKVKKMILLGECAGQIKEAALSAGIKDIVTVSSLGEAVSKARRFAKPGDAVLLSPACASWDMFRNYEERGELFKKLVRDNG